MTQLEALETTRLEEATAAQEEINARKKEARELQSQLAEARQMLQQQQTELHALKLKASEGNRSGSLLWPGAVTRSHGLCILRRLWRDRSSRNEHFMSCPTKAYQHGNSLHNSFRCRR